MGKLSVDAMRLYLSKSISSLNQNKLNGLLAEVDFRNYLAGLGFGEKVSAGGWIARCDGAGSFGHHTIVFFPHIIKPNEDDFLESSLPEPSHGLHTICSTFHQIGIHSFFCAPVIGRDNDPLSLSWFAVQLGLPSQQKYKPFPEHLTNFISRSRRFNFLRYSTTHVSSIPEFSVPEEFSKEHLRISFQERFMSEISDVDGILWGDQFTYPIEIKEKTAAKDRKLGDFFGLDVGPFVKLAFYAAKRGGNLHSIFVVREIDDIQSRNLIKWRFITFETMAQFASWNPVAGGRNMQGGGSTVVKIPKAEFQELNSTAISTL